MRGEYCKFVCHILQVMVMALNSYPNDPKEFYESSYLKRCVHIFSNTMLQNYTKVSYEWVHAYHFDNEQEEFINDDVIYDIIAIFDSINYESKKDLFNFFLILPSSDQLDQRTVALSF